MPDLLPISERPGPWNAAPSVDTARAHLTYALVQADKARALADEIESAAIPLHAHLAAAIRTEREKHLSAAPVWTLRFRRTTGARESFRGDFRRVEVKGGLWTWFAAGTAEFFPCANGASGRWWRMVGDEKWSVTVTKKKVANGV